MLYSFLTVLLLLQGVLLTTTAACPTSNGNGSDCETCAVYDYVVRETSPNMFFNVNITTHDIINDIKDFTSAVLAGGSPKYSGEEEKIPGTDAPCYLDKTTAPRTGCGQQIVVNTTEDGSLLCPWKYECDYDKNRIPQYLWKAKCLNSTEHSSRVITYRVPVLKLNNVCNPFLTNMSWKLEITEVPVACTCVNSQ